MQHITHSNTIRMRIVNIFCNIFTICVIFLLLLYYFYNLCNISRMFIIFLALVVAQDLTDYVYWHFPNPHPFAFLKQGFLYSVIIQRFLQFFLRKIILPF